VSDTSLVFNLVARDNATEELGRVREKFDAAAAGIATGVAAGLGVGVAASLDMSAANAKLQAQLGLGPAEAAELSKVSADVYANAWGDSTETVNTAIAGVYQNIGDTSQAEGGLEGLTTKALALSETFNQEVGPTTAAVGQMLRTGLAKDADEAFDILTAGLQSGANKADDLIDTVGEYGTQWRKFGLDGETAMGLLSQGLKAGARDADIVADAIKEFSIRAIDGSVTTAAGFQAIGLDAETMAAKIAAGGDSATGALDLTLDRLRNIKDPVERSAAAVQLFGTQSEDLGEALYALDPSSAVAALGKVGGAADKVTETVGESPAKALESFKREAVQKLADVSGTFVQFATDNAGVFEPLAYTLAGIAGAVLAIKGGMMVWTAAQTAWTAATTIATGAQWLWNAALAANPMIWVVVAIVAVVAAIVLIATKTTWFQQLWSATWDAVTSFTADTVGWISDSLGWFAGLPEKFSTWWGGAKDWAVTKMLELVTWVSGLDDRATTAMSGMAGAVSTSAREAFQSMKDAAVDRAASLVTWTRGLPGQLVSALSSQGYQMYNVGLDFVSGIWNGISAAGGWLWSKVTNFANDYVVEPVKNFLHIGSPSKLAADEIGHWFPAGIAMGVEDNAGVVDKAVRGLINPAAYRPPSSIASALTPYTGAASALGSGRLDVRVLFEIVGGSRAFREFLQEAVRNEAGGSIVKYAEG
jgi:phage-related minor tail protein